MVPRLGKIFQFCTLSNDLGKSHHHSMSILPGLCECEMRKCRGKVFCDGRDNTIISLFKVGQTGIVPGKDGAGQVSFFRDLMVKGREGS